MMRDVDVIGLEPTVCYQVCNIEHANSEVKDATVEEVSPALQFKLH